MGDRVVQVWSTTEQIVCFVMCSVDLQCWQKLNVETKVYEKCLYICFGNLEVSVGKLCQEPKFPKGVCGNFLDWSVRQKPSGFF